MSDEKRKPHDQIDWRAMRDNHGELAAFMLRLVDQSPDRFAIVEVPHGMVRTDREIEEAERVVSREFDRAKRDRPDLAVRLTPPTANYPDAALLVHVHEHQWVGGQCIRGCGQQQESKG